MPGTTGPRIGLVWGYSPGETGWGVSGFNPNFALLEALVHLTVISITSTTPGTPANGDCYIVGTSPTGAWAGHDKDIAIYYTSTGWMFVDAVVGLRAFNRATSDYWRFNGTNWIEEVSSTADVSGPAGAVDGNVAVFDLTTGKVIRDGGLPLPASFLVGVSDAQALTNKVIDGNDNSLLVHLDSDVTGNLPVGNLGGGVGAASSTAWFGDGTWKTVAGSGDVTGPGASVAGNLPVFADSTGKVLADSGVAPGTIGAGDVVGPAGATTGHLALFADATGKLLDDASIAAAAVAQTAGALADGYLLAADASGKIVDSGIAVSALGITVPAGAANYDQLVWDGSAWTVQRAKYIIGFDLPGVLALDRVFSHVFTKAVTIPDDFGAYLGHSSQARGSVNATSSPVITVAKATAGSPLSFSTVGTITITAGGVVPVFVTTGTTIGFAQGDTVRFKVTTGDATFADLILTIVGYES